MTIDFAQEQANTGDKALRSATIKALNLSGCIGSDQLNPFSKMSEPVGDDPPGGKAARAQEMPQEHSAPPYCEKHVLHELLRGDIFPDIDLSR